MNISPFLTVGRTCDQTLPWVQQQLTRAGLRTVQTFDLHAARAALHDCRCPNHGTDQCDCQLLVLLVYGALEEPVSLIMHGNDGQTWISVSEDVRTDAGLADQIRKILNVKPST